MEKNYLYDRNPDKSFFRTLIIVLSDFLNEKVYFKNYLNNEEIIIKIPFFYNAGGDERFLQDLFESQTRDDFILNKKVEGNIDILPRGIFTLSSVNVNSNELTSRFVIGKRRINNHQTGEVKIENTQVNLIPLTINMDVEIKTQRKIETFKIVESVIKTFYRINLVDFFYDSNYIRCYIGFPESTNFENNYNFSFGSGEIENKVNFTLELKTYLPVFSDKYKFPFENRIEKFEIYFDDKLLEKSKNQMFIEKFKTDKEFMKENLDFEIKSIQEKNSENIEFLKELNKNNEK